MQYKFYFYNGVPTAERRPANAANEGIIIEEHMMDCDDSAMLYAGDFISDFNGHDMEFDTAIEAEDYLNDIDSTSGYAFCVAIEKDGSFIYGDEDLVDYFMSKVDDDDSITEQIVERFGDKEATVDLFYKDLEFTYQGPKRDVDDWDEWDVVEDYDFTISEDDLYTFIFESCIDEEDFPEAFDDDFDPNNAEDWKKFKDWLDANYDEIFAKYEEDILANWEDEAREEAEREYELPEPDWDMMSGGHDDY